MRGLVVAVAGLAMGGLLLVAGVEGMRARLEGSAALRASVERAASSQLGAELRARGLRVDFWPARLRLLDPRVELPGEARLELDAAEVGVAAGELLRGVARVESASIAGPARLASPRLVLEGRVDVALLPDPGTRGWRAAGEIALASGGLAVVDGRFGPTGSFDGEVRFEGVESAPFAALLAGDQGRPAAMAGRFNGSFEPPGDAAQATLRLESAAARIEVPPVTLEGPVALVARLPGLAPGAPSTRFAIDASKARVEYAGGFTQATGDGASVEGRVVRQEDGRLRLEQVALEVVGFQGEHRR